MVWFLRGICKQCISRLYAYVIFKLSNPRFRIFQIEPSIPHEKIRHTEKPADELLISFVPAENLCYDTSRPI